MLRKLLRVLGIVLAAAIVIGAALLLYLEPYVTYDRDGAHLSLKKNAQDPDGTARRRRCRRSRTRRSSMTRHSRLGPDRRPRRRVCHDADAARPRGRARGARAAGGLRRSAAAQEHVWQFLLFQLHRRRGAGGRRYGGRGFPHRLAQPARLLPHCGGPGLLRHGVCAGPIPLRPSRFRAARCGWTPTAATGSTPRARP